MIMVCIICNKCAGEGGRVRMRTPSFLFFILQRCQWIRLYESNVRM